MTDLKGLSVAGKIGVGGLGRDLDSGSIKPNQHQGQDGINFKDLLKEKTLDKSKLAQSSQLKFSQHAVDRMTSRGIALKPDDLSRIEGAVGKAEKKGSRETLILMGDNAFIVNVKNKTVVTAMDRNMMKENVFTNIDSTVVL